MEELEPARLASSARSPPSSPLPRSSTRRSSAMPRRACAPAALERCQRLLAVPRRRIREEGSDKQITLMSCLKFKSLKLISGFPFLDPPLGGGDLRSWLSLGACASPSSSTANNVCVCVRAGVSFHL